MKVFSRADDQLIIRLPDTAGDVTDDSHPADTARRGSRRGPDSDDPVADELEIMLTALADAASPGEKPLTLLDRFAVDVGDGTAAMGTRRGADPVSGPRSPDTMDLDLTLGDGESAVLLIEQQGSYEWHYPTRRTRSTTGRSGRQRSSGRRAADNDDIASPADAISQVHFRVPIGTDGRLPRATRSGPTHRGPITSFIKGRIRGFILRFVARKSVGALTRRLERGVVEGPVLIRSADDALGWLPVSHLPVESLATGRARRILLLVHGTFSSTVGSFAAISTHAEGIALLEQAIAHYDLVIGFDHYTLSETPEQNAEALLQSLLPLVADGLALEIDAIAYSRGGLVWRYLSEVLIPDAGVALHCRKAIFVGCTNAGTELANDSNWKHLIDLHTNLMAGATRLLALMPGAALPATILRQGIKVIGSLVTYIAQDSISANGVPGVAAMAPDGPFVQAMNGPVVHRQLPAVKENYAIGSDFEPGGTSDSTGLGKALALKLADGLVDRLMRRGNDLVVNNDSMFVMDPLPAARLNGSRQMQSNGVVYHTLYFHQPQVINDCAHWLGLLQPVVRGGGNDAADQPQRNRSATVLARSPWWHELIAEDFLRLPFTSSGNEVLKQLRRTAARHVILQRLHQGELLYYGFTAQALKQALDELTDRQSALGDLLGLHEWQSRTLTLDDALVHDDPASVRHAAEQILPAQGPVGADLTVIVDDDEPVGLIMPVPELESRAPEARMEPVSAAESAAPPASPASRRASRPRPAPRQAPAPTPGDATAMPAGVSAELRKVWCHMHAGINREIAVESIGTLEVTLSRDLITRETGVSASGEFVAGRRVTLQALARKHCDIVGSDRCEIDLPAEGEERPVFFEIKALHEGIGEVDVFARQGNQPIIRIRLKPRFIPARATAAEGTVVASAELQPVEPREQLNDVLYIHDVQVGEERILEFNIQSRQMQLQGRYRSKPFRSEAARQAYIHDLYQEIETFWTENKDDHDAFMDQLRARGANLFESLVPEEIQKRLWKARNTLRGIQVISDEPFIPWELLYLKQPGKPARSDSRFLAQMGMLRWISNMHFAPTTLRLRSGHFRHIVPRYPPDSGYALPGAQAERRMLETRFGARPISPTSRAVKKVLQTPLAHDILHFACHGLAESASIWNSSLLMQGRMHEGIYETDALPYEWTHQFASLQDENRCGPLVFLNACQTGRRGHNLTGTGGFAQAFIRAGASAFIGSHWSIGDLPAVTFSQTLYEELIDNQASMMEAVIRAREAARNQNEVTWLAYAVYADPFARIVRE